jgi:hypothetical protein
MPAVLLHPKEEEEAKEEEKDQRVGDFLDDKLQTLADLASLDELLSNVRSQHVLLRKQVSLLSPFRLAYAAHG